MPPSYTLWFVNHASAAGQACVFQTAENFSLTPAATSSLAWMVEGAHPGTLVQFSFDLGYNYAWFNGDGQSEQIIAAPVPSQVTLGADDYGYTFTTPVSWDGPGLLILEGAHVPVGDNTSVVGLGMAGAGILGVAPAPNLRLEFVPLPATQLQFHISYGQYQFDVNDVLDPGAMNPPATIAYPAGMFDMTATLDSANHWTITAGPPALLATTAPGTIVQHRAGSADARAIKRSTT
jgi:hypothetical protein